MEWIDPDPKGEVGERVGFNNGSSYSKTRPATIVKVLKHTVHVRLDSNPMGDAIVVNKRGWKVKGEGREFRPAYIVNEARLKRDMAYDAQQAKAREARSELTKLVEEMRELVRYDLSAGNAAAIRDLAQKVVERADMAVAELA